MGIQTDDATVLAARWARRTGRDAEEALGAAWLAIQEAPVSKRDAAVDLAMQDDETIDFAVAAEMCDDRDPDQMIMERQQAEAVRTVLGRLTPRQERMIRLRHGFGADDPHTYEQIGADPGGIVCTERVRTIVAAAHRRFKSPAARAILSRAALGDVANEIAILERRYGRHRNSLPCPDYGDYLLDKAERRKAETMVGPVSTHLYREAFGRQWYKTPTSELLAHWTATRGG